VSAEDLVEDLVEDIVDAWAQHPTPRLLAHPMFDSLRRWMGAGSLDGSLPLPIEATLAAMDAARVAHAVITAWVGPDGALISNDEVAGWCRAHPDRLTGLASVDLRRPMAAVAELKRAVEVLGLRGLRILPWWWGLPPDDRRYYPLYAACVDLGVPFCLQVGHAGPLCPSEPGRPIPYLDHVALEFPELVIVAGHIGFPWTDEMIALATKYPNVYIDTSAYKPSRYPPSFVAWLRGPGARKTLFGSNWPMIPPADCVAQLDELGLAAEQRAAFLAGNARRVFQLVR
jgi:predicted TIM-barrel fold metal-dependent hydrolase